MALQSYGEEDTSPDFSQPDAAYNTVLTRVVETWTIQHTKATVGLSAQTPVSPVDLDMGL